MVVLSVRKDEPEVAVLPPAVGTLDRRSVFGFKKMGVSDLAVARFPFLRGKGWGWGALGNVANRLGVHRLVILSSRRLLR